MTRPSQKSRVSGGATPSKSQPDYQPKPIPSLRQRKPFTFWLVVLGTLAMVFSVVASFILAASGQ